MKLKRNIIIICILSIIFLLSIITIVYASQIHSQKKLSQEIHEYAIERASNPSYTEKNSEFMKRQLEILEMDTSTPEKRAEQEQKYKQLKDEMYEYSENNAKQKNLRKNENMTVEELAKKLNDMEVTYEILEKGATTEEKKNEYIDIKNKLKNMQNKLDTLSNTTTQVTKSNSSTELKNIENEYKSLRSEIGLE